MLYLLVVTPILLFFHNTYKIFTINKYNLYVLLTQMISSLKFEYRRSYFRYVVLDQSTFMQKIPSWFKFPMKRKYDVVGNISVNRTITRENNDVACNRIIYDVFCYNDIMTH